MSIFKITLPLILLISLSSCVTPYKPAGLLGNGYTDTRIDSNTAMVNIKANQALGEMKVQTYLYRRCAEVTINSGFDYFIIVSHSVNEVTTLRTDPGSYDTQKVHVKDDEGHKTTVEQEVYVPGGTYESSHFKGNATIKMYSGTKPANNPNAYNAEDVLLNTQVTAKGKH